MSSPMRVLVVDDEQPILDELAYLLGRDGRIGDVHTARSGAEALALLAKHEIDAVFLDIAMPEVSGLEIAGGLASQPRAPQVVFVTAHDDHAVDAFELNAVDYLLKPVRRSRLDEAIRRIADGLGSTETDEKIPVELGGVTRFVKRSQVAYVEAHGDYARLHVADGSHLLRTRLTALADQWAGAGFVRIHRSLLVSIAHIETTRTHDGSMIVVVRVGDERVELQASRRNAPELREVLQRSFPHHPAPGPKP